MGLRSQVNTKVKRETAVKIYVMTCRDVPVALRESIHSFVTVIGYTLCHDLGLKIV